MKAHRYKIKYGFKTSERVSVDLKELEKIIYGIQTDSMVTVGNKMIKAKNIVSIEPDYHHYTGWNENYEPQTTEDYAQIERDCPQFDGVLEQVKNKVTSCIESGNTAQIGTGLLELSGK